MQLNLQITIYLEEVIQIRLPLNILNNNLTFLQNLRLFHLLKLFFLVLNLHNRHQYVFQVLLILQKFSEEITLFIFILFISNLLIKIDNILQNGQILLRFS